MLIKGKIERNGEIRRLESDHKETILSLFLDTRNSNSEADYEVKKQILYDATRDLYVTPTGNKHPVLFQHYFDKNWHAEVKRKMWVKYHRNQFPIRGTGRPNKTA